MSSTEAVEGKGVKLELSTKEKTIDYNQQKKVYSRESILSVAASDVSPQLAEGFDHSIFRELFEGHDGLIEPWKGSNIRSLPTSSIGGCRVQSIMPQSYCNVDRKIVGPSTWLKKDKDSSEIHDPDTAGCEKAEAVDKNSTDSGKTSVSLLSKSKGPFTAECGKSEAVDENSTDSGKTSASLLSKRNAYKVGSTVFEAKSNAGQNTEVKSISYEAKQEIMHTSKEVLSNEEPTSKSNAALEEKATYSDSESICVDKFTEEQETSSSKSSPEISDFVPCSTEKALPPCLAVTSGSENDIVTDDEVTIHQEAKAACIADENLNLKERLFLAEREVFAIKYKLKVEDVDRLLDEREVSMDLGTRVNSLMALLGDEGISKEDNMAAILDGTESLEEQNKILKNYIFDIERQIAKLGNAV